MSPDDLNFTNLPTFVDRLEAKVRTPRQQALDEAAAELKTFRDYIEDGSGGEDHAGISILTEAIRRINQIR